MVGFTYVLAICSLINVVYGNVLSGTGIADCTGPINGVVMMGMANPKQVSNGLHQRLRARAFVVLDQDSGNRFAFVSMDAGMGSDVMNNRVMEQLSQRFGNIYTHENVAISGTHTHSGPSGFLQNTIFQFAGSGWVPETLDAFVYCAVESISRAHHNLIPATATVTVGRLDESNINRSPSAYLLNPEEEKKEYESEGDTDKNMTLLKILNENGTAVSMFNWFAVHPTSLNNTNTLISGDNKGHASYLFERDMNGPATGGKGPFVAGFASTNLGDVSPNTKGARCRDTGKPCDFVHSTCNGRSEQCSSSGPGKDMFDSCRIIAEKQYQKAKELFNEQGTLLNKKQSSDVPQVDFRQAFIKMPGLQVNDHLTGKPVGSLCKAAMGDSFAAGTTDGPGQFDFTQGANSSNPLWHFMVKFIHKESPEEIACQHPKGILLPTGSVNIPFPWGPSTLSVQLLRWGQFIIVVVPTEMTTMAGRRMRKHIKKIFQDGGVCDDCHVVIAGLANGYADYTVTFEEYQEQRYEAASTIFGPHQLNAYIQEISKLAQAMIDGKPVLRGNPPEDFSSKCINTGPRLKSDRLPSGSSVYGQVVKDSAQTYKAGDTVEVIFAGANPLNDRRQENSYIQVQKCETDDCEKFTLIADDADWDTKLSIITEENGWFEHASYLWKVSWEIPQNTVAGTYRIQIFGSSDSSCMLCTPKLTPFVGTSSTFTLGDFFEFRNYMDLPAGLMPM